MTLRLVRSGDSEKRKPRSNIFPLDRYKAKKRYLICCKKNESWEQKRVCLCWGDALRDGFWRARKKVTRGRKSPEYFF